MLRRLWRDDGVDTETALLIVTIAYAGVGAVLLLISASAAFT